jgi:hypothetical protein
MSEAITVKTKEQVQIALGLDSEDGYFNDVLRALNFDNLSEFTEEQISLIKKNIHLEQNNLLDYLQTKVEENGNSLEKAIHAVYAEAENTPEAEEKNTPKKPRRKTPRKSAGNTPEGDGKYTLKSLMEEIGKTIERPVKLSQMEEILELAGLGVEEEYGEEVRQALDEALPRYLARELSRKEAGSADGDIGAVIDRGVSGEVEGLTEKIAGTVANTREGLEETFQREIPRRMLAQLAAAAQSGILGQKIELAREKIAEQKRIAGETTIDVTLAGGENKQLKSAEVKEGNDGGKGG